MLPMNRLRPRGEIRKNAGIHSACVFIEWFQYLKVITQIDWDCQGCLAIDAQSLLGVVSSWLCVLTNLICKLRRVVARALSSEIFQQKIAACYVYVIGGQRVNAHSACCMPPCVLGRCQNTLGKEDCYKRSHYNELDVPEILSSEDKPMCRWRRGSIRVNHDGCTTV